MRSFNVLLTSSSPRKNDIIHCLKDNEDGVNVRVFCTNCREHELPSLTVCDGAFVVPRNDSINYIDALINLCLDLKIDIVLPRLSSELEVLAANKNRFEDIGVRVCVTDLEGLLIANDKSQIYSRYSEFMPFQITAKSSEEVRTFASRYPKFCCKLPHSSGSAGFAVIDNKLCDDVSLFHAYGHKHYISVEHLCHIVDTQQMDYIIQEFIKGNDYTVSLIADNGDISHIVGYVGYEMEFSCIMYGEIMPNNKAFDLSKRIVKDLGLSGNIGLDFILKDNGDVALLEVNPRMNATLPFVVKAGCNMPYLQCKKLLGYDISKEGQKITNGLKMRKHYVSDYFI